MRIDFVSIFPEAFAPVLAVGIPRIAQEKGAASFHAHDLRDWSADKHRKVDDRPFGGGPGMVMRPGPVVDAVETVQAMDRVPGRVLVLTAQGRPFDQAWARELSREARLVLVCGRYEGFDARIFSVLEAEELCVGDYVLSGGEVAALAVADAVVRLLPGVVGSPESLTEESFEGDVLDCPHYTQPAVWRGLEVPEVLRSGDHAAIRAWRRRAALARTRARRPDLLRGGGPDEAGDPAT